MCTCEVNGIVFLLVGRYPTGSGARTVVACAQEVARSKSEWAHGGSASWWGGWRLARRGGPRRPSPTRRREWEARHYRARATSCGVPSYRSNWPYRSNWLER